MGDAKCRTIVENRIRRCTIMIPRHCVAFSAMTIPNMAVVVYAWKSPCLANYFISIQTDVAFANRVVI